MTQQRTCLMYSIERISRFVVLFFLIFLPTTRCLYAEGGWESCGTLEGGRILELAINPQNPEILYAGTELHGVFKSLDSGETWIPANSGISRMYVHGLAINLQNPEIVYALTGSDGVFKSIDGGASWGAVNNGLPIPYVLEALAIDPQNPEILYVATYYGIFRTMDGGESWSEMNSGLDGARVRVLAINPQDPETLYAGTSEMGIFRSTDRSESWIPVNNGLSEMAVVALIIDPQNPEILYAGIDTGTYYPDSRIEIFKSINGGETWSEMSTGFIADYLHALIIDPLNPSILYAGTLYGAVYKSSNGGENWQNSSTIPYLRIFSLAVDPQSPSIVYAVTKGGGVFKSVDSGLNWRAINTGLTAVNIQTLAVDVLDDAIVYAGTSVGIFKSADACKNWIALNNGIFSGTINFNALAIDPQHPETIYAGASESHSNLVAYKSIDAGESWSELSLYGGIYAFAINPQNTAILYAGSRANHTFWTSRNGGRSWQNVGFDPWSSHILSLGKVTALAINSQDPDELYVGTEEGGLLKSNDGGWSLFRMNGEPDEIRALAVNPQSPKTVYVAGWGSGVYKTSNGWDFSAANNGITEMNATSLAIYSQRPSVVFAGTYGGGVFGSDNDGANWIPLNSGLADNYVQALDIGTAMPQRMYASTYSGQVWVRPIPFPPLSAITIATSPEGLGIKVDGTTYTTSQTFSWESGSSHTISIVTPPTTGDTRYVFANWSDRGAVSHTITVPAEATTYTANFTTQFRLTTTVSPQGGGSVSAFPVSADGYYTSGSTVLLLAIANSGYSFSAWSGDVTGTANLQTIVMSAPRNVTATFRRVNTIPSRLPLNHPRRPSIQRNRENPRELPRIKSQSFD